MDNHRFWPKVLLWSIPLQLGLTPTGVFAAEETTVSSVSAGLDALWVMVSAILVLLMQAGFVLLETGSTRMKNAGHIAGKTIFTVGMCSLVFWFAGYGLIFGAGGNAFVGWGDFLFQPQSADTLPPSVFFLFQLAFAAVSLSIAWGGFAERAKLSAYVLFTLLFTLLVYPVVAHWIWGGGWLSEHGKQDFAGSTVVHLTGAMAALAATLLLKPRIGKYNRDGSPNEIQGHNQVYTTLGVFLLWIGWFGFNAGSTLAVGDGFFGYVAFNTQLATGAGALVAMAASWIWYTKADIPNLLNGTLAGLVAITASCAFVEPWAAVVIGAIGGFLVVVSSRVIERMQIDDPISAISVHGVAGIWGTLSNGLFATPKLAESVGVGQGGFFYTGSFEQLWVQCYGVVSAGCYAFAVSFIILYLMKKAIGLRVTEEQEILGLDLSEHGSYGYPEQIRAEHQKLFGKEQGASV
ncbi:ammonium transporter [Brevibacillus massiliensis]|jgi:Amt family ammonium transporter|uniref:ammonium transporter n=1 Tax=Brevibacillus massiliensis TaxID=1118054 RepID=UPI0002F14367|nr:ammonium transporter [Brevibacillus massiliensis]